MNHSPLLLQLVIILGAARLLGFVLRFFGQPSVVGEMAAGVALGPVILGALAPDFHAYIFAPETLGPLNGLSQLGLVLFMFIVGAELRLPTGVRKQLLAAGWVGGLSVAAPLLLGLLAAVPLYSRFAPEGVAFWPFALFLASAMSITAFPVLARILKERGLTQTPIGRLSLTSAALIDVFAWIIIALVVVLAGSSQSWGRVFTTLAGLAVLIGVVVLVLKPLMARLLPRFEAGVRPEGPMLAMLLIGAFACAYAAELIKVHAVFGAFLFGACLPRDDRLLATLIERLEYIAVIALMPVFFALAGLSTTGNAFVGVGLGALLLILAAAILGKIAGGVAGARIAGEPWRAAFAVGALMNARGMMELIVIKVGLDIGVIGPELFTMLFVMALATTVMAGPLLTLFIGRSEKAQCDAP